MKRILLIAICFLTFNFGFTQTETITIPWDFFAVPRDDPNFGEQSIYDTRITIEVGDTVEWVWEGGSFHNVKSVEGQSVETFGTPGGADDTYQAPYNFSYTFTVPGENKFQCTPHSTLMFGFITVVPEGTLSISEPNTTNFKISPNPAKNDFTLELGIFNNNSVVEIYDVLGKKVLNRNLDASTTTFDISRWNSGLYIIKISSENSVLMKRFVKQ
jgi:hypothetical protein